ncbi:hypothetical protein [Marinobacter sp.]|uniref:hypothetical protein n=1 Tax=Marinobacter sp. TaxID=50741 RepID=UPI003A8F1EC0
MSIHPGQLREYVIRPVLTSLGLYSEAAVELLMLTAATESLCGKFVHQVGGPALGIFQMEPRTHDDIWTHYLAYKPELAARVKQHGRLAAQLPGNLYYACAMARVHYLRVPERLPSAADVDALARYWKAHYNTHLGAGTVRKAIENYAQYAEVD